ncbi:hypothetical protein [Arenimonas oryziterrae]|uniref:Lipocalin-like domain-containing protein n=1 Tax=Arenimonas oryziterrae DSM 21050 = YC6267 TaxID=1121015 RepID=A0A091AYB3_9GAMM|nr:hypothetical protein [Arenimonas oryziterrae]KFN43644.1 hypothetical protein N789_10230 [Arenimonas oryziterrae DSM 21050 = YC6267]
MKNILLAMLLVALCACGRAAPPTAPDVVPATTPATVPTPPPAPPVAEAQAPRPQGFVDKVWRVTESSAVQVGSTYTFLADGTLAMTAPGATPAFGRWTYVDGALTMIEEGVSYPTDILALDAHELRLRSNNPGEPVLITLQLAEGEALPAAPKQ